MATLKIITHDRTVWIFDVDEVTLAIRFPVKNFDDPLGDVPSFGLESEEPRLVTVVDFQAPDPDAQVEELRVGNVLHVRGDTWTCTRVVVAPSASCFLMSESGKTIDRF